MGCCGTTPVRREPRLIRPTKLPNSWRSPAPNHRASGPIDRRAAAAAVGMSVRSSSGDCQEFRVWGVRFLIAYAHCGREAVREENGELALGHGPIPRRHLPLLLGAVQDQEQQLQCCFIGREMPPGSNRPPELGVQSLDGIRGVDDPPDVSGEGEEGDDLVPGAAQIWPIAGYLQPQGPSSKAVSAASAALSSRAA